MSDTGGIHTSDLGLSFDLIVTAPWFFLPEGRKYLTCFCFYRKPQLFFCLLNPEFWNFFLKEILDF